MEKRGQFYLAAIIVIIAIFVGLLITQNTTKRSGANTIPDLKKELQMERGKVLDYIAINNLNSASADNILDNFSKTYVDKIGPMKSDLFFWGGTDTINVYGNSAGDVNISCVFPDGNEKIIDSSSKGVVSSTHNMGGSDSFNCSVENSQKEFKIGEGRNLYYLIRYEYNKEVYIIAD